MLRVEGQQRWVAGRWVCAWWCVFTLGNNNPKKKAVDELARVSRATLHGSLRVYPFSGAPAPASSPMVFAFSHINACRGSRCCYPTKQRYEFNWRQHRSTVPAIRSSAKILGSKPCLVGELQVDRSSSGTPAESTDTCLRSPASNPRSRPAAIFHCHGTVQPWNGQDAAAWPSDPV